MSLHPTIARVTDRIRERSAETRGRYLTRTGGSGAAGSGARRI